MASSPVAEVTPSAPEPTANRHRQPASPLYQALKLIASLKLTVVLFGLSIALVFFGTLAQMYAGVWTVVDQYFRSMIVWIPFQIFFHPNWEIKLPKELGIWYPGGWLLGALLLANLLAAHAVRFKLTWNRAGIFTIHAGLIILMIGELITGLFAVESTMSLLEGESANFVDVSRQVELVVIDQSDPKIDDIVAVPGSQLTQAGRLIQHELLPFDIRVEEYMVNSDVERIGTNSRTVNNPATTGAGLRLLARPVREVEGTASQQKADATSAYVTFLEKETGKSLGTYLVSLWLYGNFTNRMFPDSLQEVKLPNGKTYHVQLRLKRLYKDYTIYLEKFQHKKYIGTTTPKDFRSTVKLTDPTTATNTTLDIYMNAPLRHSGDTLYQAGRLPGDRGTVLQVVRNPGWTLPYVSCALVTLGMLIHFGMNLLTFLGRRAGA